jgi:hypothetical protein
MLAVQDRLIALRIIFVNASDLLLCGPGLGDGQRSPGSVADPRALLLAGVANVVKTYWLAVLLEFVFHLACQRKRLGAGKIDGAILQLACVEHGYGNEPAAVWFARLTGKLKDGDGAKFRSVFAGLCHLAWVLRASGENGKQGDGN